MALCPELDTLHASLSCCTYRGDQHTNVLIEEHGDFAKLKNVTLDVPTGDWFSFDPDRGRRIGRNTVMSPLLVVGRSHDHHRACDCVVFVRQAGKLTVLYIDLKSESPTGYANQFKSTRQFVRYALGLLGEFHGHTLSPDHERFVILYGGKPALINKTRTVSRKKKGEGAQPSNPYKREVTNPARLYLKELLN